MHPRQVLLAVSLCFLLALRVEATHKLTLVVPPVATFLQDFQDADFVLFGHLENVRKPKDSEKDAGSTDLIIEMRLKDHASLKDTQKVVIDRAIPAAHLNKKLIVFAVVRNGSPEYFRGVFEEIPGELVKYVKGMIALKGRPEVERLRFAFAHLDSKDYECARDAHSVFHLASTKVQAEAAKALSPDKLVALLRRDDAGPRDSTLYGVLLGRCGGEKHLESLWQRVDPPDSKPGGGAAGAMIGIMLIKPTEADKIVERLLNQKLEFPMRYAALTALRHMHEHEASVKKAVIEDAILKMIADPEMADFSADDLRNWKRWDAVPRVVRWFDANTHQTPIVRRSIMKFALRSPTPEAREFVNAQRKRDADWVKDIEERLNLEEPE